MEYVGWRDVHSAIRYLDGGDPFARTDRDRFAGNADVAITSSHLRNLMVSVARSRLDCYKLLQNQDFPALRLETDMRRWAYAFFLVELFTVPLLHASDSQQLQTTICEVVANPSRFDGMEISVRGYVFASVDVTNISDAACHGGFQLIVSGTYYQRKDIQRFERGIRIHGMHAMATVVGRFQKKAHVYPFPMPAIDMHSIWQVVYVSQP